MKRENTKNTLPRSKSLYLSIACHEQVRLLTAKINYLSNSDMSKNKFMEYMLDNFGQQAVEKYIHEIKNGIEKDVN